MIMTSIDWKGQLDLAIRAARRAQHALEIRSGEAPEVLAVNGREVKLSIDFTIEDLIINELRMSSEFPILSEESSHTPLDENYRWIVDPLDGSVNWWRGIPFFAISIALFKGADPVLGVVLDLYRNQLFHGAVGLGAWLNDSPIEVSKVNQMNEAILCTGFPSSYDFLRDRPDAIESIYSEYLKVRMFGSAALSLAYVASGVADVFWEEKVNLWDVAAGIALVRAAGGSVSLSQVAQDFSLSLRAAASHELFLRKSD